MSMTQREKIDRFFTLPATALALAAILFFLANAVFATDSDLAAVSGRVDTMQRTVDDTHIAVCLLLAPNQKQLARCP